jgi:hypothetical protein
MDSSGIAIPDICIHIFGESKGDSLMAWIWLGESLTVMGPTFELELPPWEDSTVEGLRLIAASWAAMRISSASELAGFGRL